MHHHPSALNFTFHPQASPDGELDSCSNRMSSSLMWQGFGVTASSTWITPHRALKGFRLEKPSKTTECHHPTAPMSPGATSTGLLMPPGQLCQAGQPFPWRNSPQHPVLLCPQLLLLGGSVRTEIASARTSQTTKNPVFVQIKLVAEYIKMKKKKSLYCSWVVLNYFYMSVYSTLLPNFTFFFVSLLSHIIFMSLILSFPLLTHQSIPIAQKEIMTQTTPLIFEEERGAF